MGSISGLKSTLLLVRPVHLQNHGSKPERNSDTIQKTILNQYKCKRKRTNKFHGIIVGD